MRRSLLPPRFPAVDVTRGFRAEGVRSSKRRAQGLSVDA